MPKSCGNQRPCTIVPRARNSSPETRQHVAEQPQDRQCDAHADRKSQKNPEPVDRAIAVFCRLRGCRTAGNGACSVAEDAAGIGERTHRAQFVNQPGEDLKCHGQRECRRAILTQKSLKRLINLGNGDSQCATRNQKRDHHQCENPFALLIKRRTVSAPEVAMV